MISINYRDSAPIYKQIENEFKKMILSGIMEKDSPLPSVRQLASSMAINPNTIQRAYAELEAGGFIYSVPGKGNFVSSPDEARLSRRHELSMQFKKIVGELRALGAEKNDLMELLKESEVEND